MGMSLDNPSEPASISALRPQHGGQRGQNTVISFDRRELSMILGIYGRMLAIGMARDYAIDHTRERAVFSIFRRTSEVPLYQVEKKPKDSARQGAFSVTSPSGGTLKRGRDLAQVLKFFDRKLIRAVD